MGGGEERDRAEQVEAACVRPPSSDPTGERLRLGAAMAHVVPGLELTLWSRGEPVLLLGGQPGRGDVDPCAFRTMMLRPGAAGGRLAAVDEVTARGSDLREVGGDVVARRLGDGHRWWWPTRVAPDRLEDVLTVAADELVRRDEVAPDIVAAADVRIRVDVALGVSVIELAAPPPGHDGNGAERLRAGDDLALGSWRACVVAELLG